MVNAQPAGSKRDRTRIALLVATQELLLERSAGSLSIRDIASRAGVVQGTFYNYFDTIEAVLDEIGVLFYALHAQSLATLNAGITDAAEVFARSTRHTLRFVTQEPGYGRLLFDAGLPIDRFLHGLRASLREDVAQGIKQGVFKTDDLELTVGMIAGSLLGVSLDIHRGLLPPTAIERATQRLLVALGVAPVAASGIVKRRCVFQAPPALPLRGLAAAPNATGESHESNRKDPRRNVSTRGSRVRKRPA